MHGLGNDFVILFDEVNIPKANVIRALSDRKKGIGCDMVVILNKYKVIWQIIKLFFLILMVRLLKYAETL